MSAKEHSDLRQGISFLFPRVQMLNRVTLLKILLINLKTAFPRIQWKSCNATQDAFIIHILPTGNLR